MCSDVLSTGRFWGLIEHEKHYIIRNLTNSRSQLGIEVQAFTILFCSDGASLNFVFITGKTSLGPIHLPLPFWSFLVAQRRTRPSCGNIRSSYTTDRTTNNFLFTNKTAKVPKIKIIINVKMRKAFKSSEYLRSRSNRNCPGRCQCL